MHHILLLFDMLACHRTKPLWWSVRKWTYFIVYNARTPFVAAVPQSPNGKCHLIIQYYDKVIYIHIILQCYNKVIYIFIHAFINATMMTHAFLITISFSVCIWSAICYTILYYSIHGQVELLGVNRWNSTGGITGVW